MKTLRYYIDLVEGRLAERIPIGPGVSPEQSQAALAAKQQMSQELSKQAQQRDIPNMQIIGELGDGFANIRYNGMAGVLDQQSNKMILISPKVPDAYQIVTVAGGRESTEYVGADQIGPATRKALDSIIPRQRPRPPAPMVPKQ